MSIIIKLPLRNNPTGRLLFNETRASKMSKKEFDTTYKSIMTDADYEKYTKKYFKKTGD